MKRAALVWTLLVVLAALVSAQSAPSTAAPAALPAAVPYSDSEFPPWVLKLRRAEIIAVGTFPLAYLFAGLGFDYSYYMASGFSQAYAPWPVGPGTSQWTVSSQPAQLQQKNITLLGAAAVVSLLVAGADWLLGL